MALGAGVACLLFLVALYTSCKCGHHDEGYGLLGILLASPTAPTALRPCSSRHARTRVISGGWLVWLVRQVGGSSLL